MKEKILASFIAILLVLSVLSVSALNSQKAKQNWLDAKNNTISTIEKHNLAKAKYKQNPTQENLQLKISTGKDVLNAFLDEADAWLIWQEESANENSFGVDEKLLEEIKKDIKTNREKIEILRGQVENIKTEIDLQMMLITMIAKSTELFTDVARDVGKIGVYRAREIIKTTEQYEQSLRKDSENFPNRADIIIKLDLAKQSIEQAKTNVNNAENSYNLVQISSNPLIPFLKFNEGNQYMRMAVGNMASANLYLNEALQLMI